MPCHEMSTDPSPQVKQTRRKPPSVKAPDMSILERRWSAASHLIFSAMHVDRMSSLCSLRADQCGGVKPLSRRVRGPVSHIPEPGALPSPLGNASRPLTLLSAPVQCQTVDRNRTGGNKMARQGLVGTEAVKPRRKRRIFPHTKSWASATSLSGSRREEPSHEHEPAYCPRLRKRGALRTGSLRGHLSGHLAVRSGPALGPLVTFRRSDGSGRSRPEVPSVG
jgi:hypothetical protein